MYVLFSFLDDIVELIGSSDSNLSISQGSPYIPRNFKPGPSEEKRSRGTKNIIDAKLVATLDKCLISDRNATRLIIAITEALGHDPREFVINKSSINACRQKVRQDLAEKFKEQFSSFKLNASVLHFDGKLMQEMLLTDKVDRLAIIITDGELEKILSIPALTSGTGVAQANAIVAVN